EREPSGFPFASDQKTFWNFFEVSKSSAACRKSFFDRLGTGDKIRLSSSPASGAPELFKFRPAAPEDVEINPILGAVIALQPGRVGVLPEIPARHQGEDGGAGTPDGIIPISAPGDVAVIGA